MKDSFPLEQFRDAFEVTTKIKNKLQPFIAKYKEQNMSWIIKSMEELHRLFFEKEVEMHLKFNSIFGLKFIFDTGDLVLINFIEIYFLPKILDIACYEINISDEKRGTTYFINQGYPKDNPDAVKFGYNFVRMASQFIPAAAAVKPRRILQGEELHEPSDFGLALIKLKETGWKPYPSPVYYKEGVAQTIRKNFENSLQQQAVDNYVNFFTDIFKQFIVEEKMPKMKMSPFKIIEFCDSYVTAALVQLCEEEFSNPSLKRRKNALVILNELIKWGDIEAAHLVNCTSILDQTVSQISDPSNGSRVLSRGKSIFKKNNSTEAIKQEFYVQFLKCLQFWALCLPKGIKIKNRESKVKFIHDELRNKLQIEFPEDRELKKNKAIFDKASQKNKKRNEKLLVELRQLDSDLLPLPSLNSIPSGHIKQQKKQEPIEEQYEETPNPTPSGPAQSATSNDFDRLKRNIIQVNACIDTLCDNEGKIQAKIIKIAQFTNRYESQIETANLSNQQFDEIFNKADVLIERITKVNLHIDKYRSKKISFDQLNGLIHNRKPTSPQKRSEAKIQSKKDIKQISEESLNISAGDLPKIDSPHMISSINLKKNKQTSPLHKAQEVSKPQSSLNHIDDVTPIKRMKEEFDDHQKFEDSKDMSSLPEMSRKSVEVSKESFKNFTKPEPKRPVDFDEAINIQPASHTIIDSSKVSVKKIDNVREPEKKVENIPNSFKRFVQNNERQSEKKKSEQVQQSFKRFMERQSPIKGEIQSRPLIEVPDQLDEFQEEVDQKINANIPKSLKNITGSNKGRPEMEFPERGKYQIHVQTPSENIFRGENSRKSSKIKFEESRVSKPEEEEDENDLIMCPDSNPLEMSYHQIKVTDSSYKNPNELSFKKCFEEDKYLFGADRQIKKYKLANDTFNLIKRADSSRKQSRNKDSKISIPSILDQRNKKFEEEIKYIEQKKNSKISELEVKIKLLESTGSVMKERIIQQQKEIKTIKAFSEADNSRVKKNSILEDQDAIFKAKLATVQNRSVKDQSFYQSRKDPRYLDPMGTLINSRKYNEYFQQFKGEKQKKNLLKNKQLLSKNDSIEFGCMTKRDREALVVTFFITPASDLDGLVSRVISADSNLDIELEPKSIPSIRKGKQEKVTVSISAKNIPYHLPQIEFTYNLEHKLDTQTFIIPCAFHKFIHLAPTDQKQILRHFDKREKILRGEQVPYSKKLLKSIGNLSDYFAGGVLMRSGEPNPNGELEFGGRAVWKHEQFWIRLMVRPNQFLYVQAVGDSGSSVQEFYLSLITNLLMKNIDLKEM